jgi:hypothetical protein
MSSRKGATHWSAEERELVQSMAGDLPFDMVTKLYTQEAARRGWPQRSKGAIQSFLNRVGASAMPTGSWMTLGALERLGISGSNLFLWCSKGILPAYQPRPCTKRMVRRADVVALAKREPWRFGGCDEDALFELLEDRKLAERIATEYPFRATTRRRVRCLDTGEVFESVQAAAAAVPCDVTCIRRSARLGKEVLGRRYEYVRG